MTITELSEQSVQSDPKAKGVRLERCFTKEGVHPYDEI